jgi:hypothetical protein
MTVLPEKERSVMANTNAPNGFQQYLGGSGGVPTFAQSKRRIASGNTSPIYTGDPVNPVVSTANGYITVGVPGTVRIDGIFAGCKYNSVAMKRPFWNNYWPGSDATGDVEAYVIDDPNAQFVAQGNSTTFNITGTLSAWTSSPVGQYAQYAIGTGNASTGQSGAYLNSLATTVTLPFIVRDLITAPPGGPGADPTTAYNKVVVGFNNEWMRTSGAGPTGIS